MSKVTITVGNKGALAPDELEIDIRLRGKAEAVVGAMVHGFPREALEKIRDAFDEEMRRRKDLEQL